MQNGKLKQVFYLLLFMCFLFTKIEGQTTYPSSDLPITISSTEVSVITSTITVSEVDCISDVNVLDLEITHSWVSDLYVTLTSPEGTTVVLLDQVCGNYSDIDLNIDDSGTDYISIPCPPTGEELITHLEI